VSSLRWERKDIGVGIDNVDDVENRKGRNETREAGGGAKKETVTKPHTRRCLMIHRLTDNLGAR